MVEENLGRCYTRTLGQVARYSAKTMPDKLYHDFSHAYYVADSAERIAKLEGLDEKSIFLLKTAAYLHDLVHVTGANNNEEESAFLSKITLPGYGYAIKETDNVCEIIMATKWPTSPKDKLGQIICDADLSNLGDIQDFSCLSNLLRIEMDIGEEEWLDRQIKFLSSFKYYTESAKKLYSSGLQTNLQRLKEEKARMGVVV